jgi:hypothetical protein
MYTAHVHFYEFRPFCIDNARVIYRKIRYVGGRRGKHGRGPMEETEEAGRQRETRKFYRKVNIIRKGYKPSQLSFFLRT